MFKWLAFALILFASSAAAQNSTCANRSTTDNSNACANTHFVKTVPIAPGQLPLPTTSSLGGVQANNAVADQFLTQINTSGVPVLAKPTFNGIANLSTQLFGTANTWTATQNFSAITVPSLPGLSSNVVGSGVAGLSGGQWFIYNAPSVVPSYLAGLRTQFDPNYTGGTPGVTRYAHWVLCNPTAGVADYIWCGLDELTNFATGGQNTARYIQATKKSGAGPTFGFVSELRDDSGLANPTSGLVNEIDIVVNGTDTNKQRAGIDLVAKTYGAGAAGHVGRAFMLSSNGGAIFDSVLSGNANIGDGIDFTGMTVTGSPFKSVGFSIDNVGNSISKSSAATAFVANGSVPTVTGSGACTISTQVGGQTAGRFTATAACAAGQTYTISGMPAATNGYVCDAGDRTTTGVVFQQTSDSTTSAVMTVRTTGVSNADVIQFKCMGY